MAVSITHDFDKKIVQHFQHKIIDFRQPLTDWYGYMRRRTDLTFKRLGAKNAPAFRGVKWEWFADQYTRKKGNPKSVPAEGGVERVRAGRTYRTLNRGGKATRYRQGAGRDIATRAMTGTKVTSGPILGKLRNSKSRVTLRSKLLQDRGDLPAAAMAQFKIQPKLAVFRTPLKYAQFIQKKRPFVFITEDDATQLARMINKHLKTP